MPQPSLRELQSWLRWIITDPRGVPEGLQKPHPSSEEVEPFRFVASKPDRALDRYRAPSVDCLLEIQDSERFRREGRLSVYAEAYFTRVSQSLAEDFAAVKRLVGEDGLEQLVADYLKEYPSRYENLAEVGRQFPTFLAAHEASRSLPFIIDLAKLEWKIIESFHAEDASPIDLAGLQRITPEQWPDVTFVLDPSLRLFSSPWNVDMFWGGENHEITKTQRFLMIFREEGDVNVQPISASQFTALRMAADGKTLGEICGRLEDSATEDPVAGIQDWFGEWIQRGVIRQVRCKL